MNKSHLNVRDTLKRLIERMNEEIRQKKFTYITFTATNIDGVIYETNELMEIVDYNNYNKYIEEYKSRFDKTEKIKEEYNKKMKEEIKEKDMEE